MVLELEMSAAETCTDAFHAEGPSTPSQLPSARRLAARVLVAALGIQEGISRVAGLENDSLAGLGPRGHRDVGMYPIEASCILGAAIALPADDQYFVLGEHRTEHQSTRQRRSAPYATREIHLLFPKLE